MNFWWKLGGEVFEAAFFIVLVLHLAAFIRAEIKQLFGAEGKQERRE